MGAELSHSPTHDATDTDSPADAAPAFIPAALSAPAGAASAAAVAPSFPALAATAAADATAAPACAAPSPPTGKAEVKGDGDCKSDAAGTG